MRSSETRGGRRGVVLALALGCSFAHADPPNALANAQTALARAQGLLRQLNEQKQQADVENAKLKATTASLEQELKHAKLESAEREADITARAKEAEQVNARLSHSNARNDKLTDKLKQVIAKYKETARGLKQSQAERDQLQSGLIAAKIELADAEKKNLALYQTNREILETYKKKSGWTALLQQEPVTGIKQVEIESKIEQIEHDMVDQLRDSNLDAAQ